jgi:hypothetical protein
MTNLEALRHSVAAPVSDGSLEIILTDRGINKAGTYAGKNREFDLAKADLYVLLATHPNISEGGYSVSYTEKENLLNLANNIYGSYGEPLQGKPSVRDASHLW